MALYLIGDVQGCDEALGRLLDEAGFSAGRDTLVLLGDLVNRGPASAAVVRRLMKLGSAARCLLGNHDLHLLAIAQGAQRPHRSDTLSCILDAPDRAQMLGWLRNQSLALLDSVAGQELLMVHAGVVPSWSAQQCIGFAHEVEQVLRGPQADAFLGQMYGNEPQRWDDRLQGPQRLRAIVNILTRIRFCAEDGTLEFATKEAAATAPAGFLPWFDWPQRRTANTTVAFGHWSTLGWLGRGNLLSLDTGCVWGGCLSAVRITAGVVAGGPDRELVQVRCPQALRPTGWDMP